MKGMREGRCRKGCQRIKLNLLHRQSFAGLPADINPVSLTLVSATISVYPFAFVNLSDKNPLCLPALRMKKKEKRQKPTTLSHTTRHHPLQVIEGCVPLLYISLDQFPEPLPAGLNQWDALSSRQHWFTLCKWSTPIGAQATCAVWSSQDVLSGGMEACLCWHPGIMFIKPHRVKVVL